MLFFDSCLASALFVIICPWSVCMCVFLYLITVHPLAQYSCSDWQAVLDWMFLVPDTKRTRTTVNHLF